MPSPQGAMHEERGDTIYVPGERVLATGVRDERRWGRGRGECVGEGEQHGVDLHDPQLGRLLPGLRGPRRPVPLLQDHVLRRA